LKIIFGYTSIHSSAIQIRGFICLHSADQEVPSLDHSRCVEVTKRDNGTVKIIN